MVNRGFESLIKLIEYKILTLQTSHGVRFRKVVGDTLASEKKQNKRNPSAFDDFDGLGDSYLHKGAFVDSLWLIREKTFARRILNKHLWPFERMTRCSRPHG